MKTHLEKKVIYLLFGLLLVTRSYGYLLVPYESLKKMSDVIVIAVPLQNTDTTNRWSAPASPHDIPVIGVETRFEILTILKGDLAGKEFVLSHYKWADSEFRPGRVGPSPRAFDTTNKNRFLMFLKRDGDKIVPVLKSDTTWSVKMMSDDQGFGAPQGDPAPIKAVINYSVAPWDYSAYEILIPVPRSAEGSDPFIRIDIWGNPEFEKAKSFHFSKEDTHKDGGRAVFQTILNKSSPVTLTGSVSFRALQKGQPVFGSFEFAAADGRTLKASFEATWGNKPIPYIR